MLITNYLNFLAGTGDYWTTQENCTPAWNRRLEGSWGLRRWRQWMQQHQPLPGDSISKIRVLSQHIRVYDCQAASLPQSFTETDVRVLLDRIHRGTEWSGATYFSCCDGRSRKVYLPQAKTTWRFLQLRHLLRESRKLSNSRKNRMYGIFDIYMLFNLTFNWFSFVNFFADKRVFRKHLRYIKERTHEETLDLAESVASGEYTEMKGIMGKSPFFNAHDFNIIDQIIPEPMHLLDGGFTKNIAGRTFNSGTSQQSEPGYRRSPIGPLTDEIV